MAISTVPPAAADHGDLMTLTQAIGFFAEAGISTNKSALHRLIAEYKIPTVGGGRGRQLQASVSDLLEAYGSRHPRRRSAPESRAVP
ncbi:hypothetical protein [Streptomyces chilikensis]|uniref:Uncharacterized protein n=1 Tax=Streptomyces chilikensis TaxID=1194079 RepID=A0ABV3ERE2_9ACTN